MEKYEFFWKITRKVVEFHKRWNIYDNLGRNQRNIAGPHIFYPGLWRFLEGWKQMRQTRKILLKNCNFRENLKKTAKANFLPYLIVIFPLPATSTSFRRSEREEGTLCIISFFCWNPEFNNKSILIVGVFERSLQ